MKMAKLHLAMRDGGSGQERGGGASSDGGGVHMGPNGVVMVARHAPCWPPGMSAEMGS